MDKIVGIAVASQELKVLLRLSGASNDATDAEETSIDGETVKWAEEQAALIEAAAAMYMYNVDEVRDDAEPTNGELEENKDDDVLVLPYNEQGLKEILRIAAEEDASTVILAGNHLWAKAIAYALVSNHLEVRYVSPRKQERGKVTSQVNFLRNALEHGFTGRPFFGLRYKNGATPSNGDEVAHPWVELAKRGATIDDDLRRVKHRIQNVLRVIFPELIVLGQKLWGKKVVAALEVGQFSFFSRYGLDYTKSLARYIPLEETIGKGNVLISLLSLLRATEATKAEYEREVYNLTDDHLIVKMFEGSKSAQELALLIGWRKWGRTGDNKYQRRTSFRELRKYCGLAVSRVDSKGNPRISRERPEIRVNLYHMLRTGVARQILAEAAERLGRDRMKRPKRMDILLKVIWKQCLLER